MHSHPPLVIIGMHRSGTSLLARMLESLGVFMGYRKDQNHEAKCFLRLNTWMFRQSGGAWDRPEPVREMLENEALRALVTDYVRRMLHSRRAADYLGPRHYRGPDSLWRMAMPWGWKDPRSTCTLPVWLDLFPDARVIHTYRNGVDVARSLLVRAERRLEEAGALVARARWTDALRVAPLPRKHKNRLSFEDELLMDSVRCLDPRGGFEVWEAYISEARRQLASLPADRILEVRYEDFLAQPEPGLKGLCDFLGLEPDAALIARCAATVDPGRAAAYSSEERWQRFFEQARGSATMRSLGYR